MIIIHKLEDFTFELFPDAQNVKDNIKELESYFENFYAYGDYKPVVKVKGSAKKYNDLHK